MSGGRRRRSWRIVARFAASALLSACAATPATPPTTPAPSPRAAEGSRIKPSGPPLELLAESHCAEDIEEALDRARAALGAASERHERSVSEAAQYRIAELTHGTGSVSVVVPPGARVAVKVDGVAVAPERAVHGVTLPVGHHRVQVEGGGVSRFDGDVCVMPGRPVQVDAAHVNSR